MGMIGFLSGVLFKKGWLRRISNINNKNHKIN